MMDEWSCAQVLSVSRLLSPAGSTEEMCCHANSQLNELYWLLAHSVNIKAESPDPTSSWRSLIPVIKMNISTVSIRPKTVEFVQKERRILVFRIDDIAQKNQVITNSSGLVASVCLCRCRAVWRLGTTTSPRLCVWTLRTPSWRTPPSLHPATWTSTCTSSKAHWRTCASCWCPARATLACRMMSKSKCADVK